METRGRNAPVASADTGHDAAAYRRCINVFSNRESYGSTENTDSGYALLLEKKDTPRSSPFLMSSCRTRACSDSALAPWGITCTGNDTRVMSSLPDNRARPAVSSRMPLQHHNNNMHSIGE